MFLTSLQYDAAEENANTILWRIDEENQISAFQVPNMKWVLFSAVLILFISSIVCPPVKVKKEEKKKEPDVEPAEDVVS